MSISSEGRITAVGCDDGVRVEVIPVKGKWPVATIVEKTKRWDTCGLSENL
jgi:hypothetical protein